ncbi:hypothetical protein NYA30BAC_01520 [Halomonas sp. NYA30]
MTDNTHQPTFKTVNQIPLGNRLLRRKDVEQKTGKSRKADHGHSAPLRHDRPRIRGADTQGNRPRLLLSAVC